MTNTPSAATLRRFLAQPCDFILAAAEGEHLDSLPKGMPEVAFWGRSNVGKSSLINAVMNRKALARTSNTPGRTQQIIFFNFARKLLLADLPGYGHAKAPKADIERWNRLIHSYLASRTSLLCVFLLIDGRHGILEQDEAKMAFLDKMAVNYQVVLTKGDQIRGSDPAARVAEVQAKLKKHPAARPDVFMTSASKGDGLDGVRAALYGFSK